MGQPGLFDLDERYRRLPETGDPLVQLASLVDFEIFRPRLVAALKRSDGSKGGRPPYDPVLVFKILILQTLYTLSDDATEFQIRDRLSFMRFLRLGLEDAVPDAKTIWLFREQLTKAGAIKDLFAEFDGWLKGRGYLAMSGQIVDASIIAAPRQRNTDAEKAALKEGRIPEDWRAKPAQKDRDARWTLKRAKARKAKADGTKARGEIARNTASDVWADTAYRTKANEAFLTARGLRSRIHFRRRPGQDLTAPQKKANRARSKVRSAVEGVFAHQKQVFGLVVRTIGMARATTKIALANLAYNVRRYIWLVEHQPAA